MNGRTMPESNSRLPIISEGGHSPEVCSFVPDPIEARGVQHTGIFASRNHGHERQGQGRYGESIQEAAARAYSGGHMPRSDPSTPPRSPTPLAPLTALDPVRVPGVAILLVARHHTVVDVAPGEAIGLRVPIPVRRSCPFSAPASLFLPSAGRPA